MALTRRNLPHLYFDRGIYFITFRLADSLPSEIVAQINNLCYDPKNNKDKRLFQKYDKILDSGKFGVNYLVNENIAGIVMKCIHYPDNKDYKLICYSIMSNHVHLVFELLEKNKGISKIMQSIKRISARKSNVVLNRSGKFWQDESFDRLIRNENEFFKILNYVLKNPVKAGLVNHWKEWKFSYCIEEFVELIPE